MPPYIQAFTLLNSRQLVLPTVKGMRNEILIGLFLEPVQMSNHILSLKWCDLFLLSFQSCRLYHIICYDF